MSIYNKNTGMINTAKPEPDEVHYQVNNMIRTKCIWPKSPHFGKKGWAYFIKNDGWLFRPSQELVEDLEEVIDPETGESDIIIVNKLVNIKHDVTKDNKQDDIRMPWYYLDCNIEEGFLSRAVYVGINPSFVGKEGNVFIKANYTWEFQVAVDGEIETINLASPESVKLI